MMLGEQARARKLSSVVSGGKLDRCWEILSK
jgi:hypothetical protein